MAGINSCSPNANHDNGEKGNHIPSAFTNNGIHQCNYHIGRVQWRHCRKYICITPVDWIKDSHSKECIKATQSCNIARCVQYRFEAVVDGIPRRSSRMNVITGKANQIDEQEYQRKTKVGFSFLLKIQAKTEQDNAGKDALCGTSVGQDTTIL